MLHITNTGNAAVRNSSGAGSLAEMKFYTGTTYKGATGYQNTDDYFYIYQVHNIFFKNGSIGLYDVNNPIYGIDLPYANHNLGYGRAYGWLTHSDGRLKSKRETIPYGLNEVMQLHPLRYFHHNSSITEGTIRIEEAGKPDIGFIAQDLFKIIPEVVTVPEDETSDLWSMTYEKLTPVLVRAIQELKAENDRLKQENQDMNARLERLEKALESMAWK